MKNFLILFSIIFTSIVQAQSEIYVGTYEKNYKINNGDFHHYRISLNPDGTFTFQSHSIISKRIPSEKKEFGKGSWSADKNIITLTTDSEKDLDKIYTVDLSNTKAKYVSKSPRNKSNRIIPNTLKFYQSDISWIKGKELLQLN